LWIQTAEVQYFRNIRHIKCTFAPGVNVIYGVNAQGKTNMLEALYMLVTGRSFRGSPDKDLIPWNPPEFYAATIVRAQVDSKISGSDKFLLSFDQTQKCIMVNDVPLKRLGELIGKFNCVLFTPFDLDLVTGPPTRRRRFVDLLLSQIDAQYLYHLQRYDKALRQCNMTLKYARSNPKVLEQLFPWQEQMSEHGSEVIMSRRRYLQEIDALASAAYTRFAKEASEEFSLHYMTNQAFAECASATDVSQLLLRTMRNRTDDDIGRGFVSVGPHRDDLALNLYGRSADDFASQGQQRSIAIALKQAELELLTQIRGERPMLMLDDILSELDENRRRALIDFMPEDVQTFVTTTDATLIQALHRVEKSFNMDAGMITDGEDSQNQGQ